MKKVILSAAVFSLITSAVFTSCKKEEEETQEQTYASISGLAQANLDETNDTTETGAAEIQYETANEGTKVIAKVNPMDYTNNPDASVNYETVTYETSIGSDGKFAFDTIRAYSNSMMVTITFSDFAADKKEWVTPGVPDDGTETNREVYTTGDQVVSVVAYKTKIVDVTYN